MDKKDSICCPYCSCDEVSKSKDKGLIEISGLEFSEEEEYPVDVWVCSKCQRRFVMLDEAKEK